MGHADRAHALLSASSAHRWLNCTPSAVAAELYPRETSEFAAEGTQAHEVAEAFVRANLTPLSIETEPSPDATPEMLDCAAGYNAYIREQFSGDHHRVLLEQRVDFSEWVPYGFGTCDCIILQNETMDVIDYKFGKGVPVNAERNPQLMLYGLGALNDYGLACDVQTVRLHIYQPRINNISVWGVSATDLLKWADSVKEVAAVAATGGGGYRAGDWCKFCPHAGECRELARTCTRTVDGYDVEVPVLAPHEVAEILEREPLISLWLRRVKARALAMALDGKPAPGWKAVEGRQGNRKWKDELEALHILDAAGYDRAETTETHLLSPAGVDKLVGKKKAAELLAGQIERSPGAPILVPESDKRPPYDPANDFDNID